MISTNMYSETLAPDVIDAPAVVAEVTAAFERYQTALVANDIAVLDSLFWNDPRALRYGMGEALYGHAAIAAFRAARPPQGLARTVLRSVVTSYGRDFATTHIEFERTGLPGRGRQSQTWVRFAQGWRIVAAHVSVQQ